jgi:mercuric ion transport protein
MRSNTSRGYAGSATALFSGFGAGACCIVPIAAASLGAGAGLASAFDPVRSLFTVMLVVGLGVGFYGAYRRPPRCEDGGCVHLPSVRRRRLTVWVAAALATLMWSSPYWRILFA